jgi:hypothetical protein
MPEGTQAAAPAARARRAPRAGGAAPALAPGAGGAPAPAERLDWLLLIYRVPSEPSNNRVSVWRELKRLGALYLQQCVCVVPALPACEEGVRSAVRRVEALGGSSNLFRLTDLEDRERERLVDGFRGLSAKEYAEIVEECRTKFAKEIEFERFRENYTYEEAEEIREDLDKIRRWYDRVVARDWFDAGQREAVAGELAECERLLEAFEEEVYRRAGDDHPTPPAGAPPSPSPPSPGAAPAPPA